MASARTTREGERRLSLRTLVIASLASAAAAVVVSTFWRSGTPIAAAITPVIVALVSEMLHRPTAVIAERLTHEGDALPLSARIPRLGERAPEPGRVRPAPEQPPRVPREDEPPRVPRQDGPRSIPTDNGGDEMRVYPGAGRAGARRAPPNLPWKAIAVTAALAFVIGATVLTVPELLAGQSVGGGRTTVFGGGTSKSTSDQDSQSQDRQDTTTEPQQTTPQQQRQVPQQTTPQKTTPQTNQQRKAVPRQTTTPTTPTTPKKSP